MTGIYFSGTGNTKFCLKRFLDGVQKDNIMYSIEDAQAVTAIKESTDIVFAYPIYYSNLPKIVRDFIEQNKHLWAGKNIYIIATMGLFSGDGAGVSARLFKKYGAKVTGGLHLRMPDCIGDVKALKKTVEENKEIIRSSCAKIDHAVTLFLSGKPTREGLNLFYHLAGLFGQRLYFRNKTKEYTQNPTINKEICTGCGLCERVCPMHNIHVEHGKAVAGSQCTMCYRCFANCPTQSITIIGKKVIEQYKLEDDCKTTICLPDDVTVYSNDIHS